MYSVQGLYVQYIRWRLPYEMTGVLVASFRSQNLSIGTTKGVKSKMTMVRIIAVPFRILRRKNYD